MTVTKETREVEVTKTETRDVYIIEADQGLAFDIRFALYFVSSVKGPHSIHFGPPERARLREVYEDICKAQDIVAGSDEYKY